AENHCSYCVAAHSVIAKHMVKADPAIVDALRNLQPLPDSKLDALANFTRSVVKNRGAVCNKTLDNFITAGYSLTQVLEVVLGVAFKTLSNYTNHIIDTPLDNAFQPEAWEKPAPCGIKQCA
ncbi:MAG: carboxymuconolactone decarboxylase family protein, partial [Gammaproteobacteria bacterium]